MKCLVIEDELPARELLQRYISQKSDIECLGVFESINELSLELLPLVDFILLDIQLPGVNGLHFLKNLEVRPKIIITTAYRDYAIEAFEEDVCDYLLKPFSYERFLKAILRVWSQISEENENYNRRETLFVYADKTFFKINKTEISYLKAESDYVLLHHNDKKLLVNDSLHNLGKKLMEDDFVRVHRSFLINYRKIDRVVGNLIYLEGVKIPIGKTYRSDFFKLIKTR